MRSLVIAVSLVACSAPTVYRPAPAVSRLVFREEFDDAAEIQRGWTVTSSGSAGLQMQIEDASAKLTADGQAEVMLRRRLDVTQLRGKRVLIAARVRSERPTRSWARVKLTVFPAGRSPSYRDSAATKQVSSLTWTEAQSVIDVDPGATSAELLLVQHGKGAAWFDDIEISTIGPSHSWATATLTPRQLDNAVALTRVIALVRYLHPSDEAATLDWDRFTAMAMKRVLAAPTRQALLAELEALFTAIAPTVAFRVSEAPAETSFAHPVAGEYLARWRHFGLGPVDPYFSFREGRDDEGDLSIDRYARIELPNARSCKRVRVDANARFLGGSGKASVFVELSGAGVERTSGTQAVTDGAREVSVEADAPSELHEVRLGVRVRGRAGVVLERATIGCVDSARAPVSITGDWIADGATDLFDWSVSTCERGPCATLARKPLATELVPARDTADHEIGSGLRVRVPLAVWANAQQTLPTPQPRPDSRSGEIRHELTMSDVPGRLAAVCSTWATVSLFYPYFEDLKIDWLAALAPALEAASVARTPEEHHAGLARLVAGLRDGHARVVHATAPITGRWPLSIRRFGDKLVVTGGLEELAASAPVGSELVAIDGVPAIEQYERVRAGLSAGTPGWQEQGTGWYLTLGPVGAFRSLRLRTPDRKESEHAIPLVSRELNDARIKERRPSSGTEVAPGIIYVDLEALKSDGWRKLLPGLARARALIFDFRGYVSSGTLAALASLADRPLYAPPMLFPRVGESGSAKHLTTQWSIRPTAPRLTAPVIGLIDGRAYSAVETALQIFRENRLGLLVGETTGGANGNANTFEVAGEFTIRFTGMRVSSPDGTTVHGRGFAPDIVVVPTLEGFRAGRDEILEAGIKAAQEQAARGSAGKGS